MSIKSGGPLPIKVRQAKKGNLISEIGGVGLKLRGVGVQKYPCLLVTDYRLNYVSGQSGCLSKKIQDRKGTRGAGKTPTVNNYQQEFLYTDTLQL